MLKAIVKRGQAGIREAGRRHAGDGLFTVASIQSRFFRFGGQGEGADPKGKVSVSRAHRLFRLVVIDKVRQTARQEVHDRGGELVRGLGPGPRSHTKTVVRSASR